MKNRGYYGFIGLLALMMLAGCKKYDEGPLFDLYSIPKRVQGSWYFERVEVGEIDSTDQYKYGRIEFGLYEKESGGFVWDRDVYHTEEGPSEVQAGLWKLYADRDSFEMKLLNLITKDTIYWQWKIQRLAYNEFWMIRHQPDSTRIYWKLWKFVR